MQASVTAKADIRPTYKKVRMSHNPNMTLQATLERPDEKSTFGSLQSWLEWPGRICLIAAVLVTPWLFGGYYFSAKFLVAILMLVGLGALWFEAALSERKSLILPWLLLPLMIGIGIVLLQMVPLPKSMEGLLGRQRELYTYFGGEESAASISMNRAATWDRLGMLVIALAGVCLGARYFRSNAHGKLLLAVGMINGVTLSLFGMIQSLTGGASGTIYWVIRLLRGGAPFGPYVNRNSAAGYLLICLGCAIGLTTIVLTRPKNAPQLFNAKDMPFFTQLKMQFLLFVSELDATKLACLIGCTVIGTGVVASLSRGGTLAMLFGCFVTLLFFGMARKPSFSSFVAIPAILFAAMFAGWLGFGTKLMERFESVESAKITEQEDVRIKHWADTWPAVADFGVFGSGVGAYSQVHRLYRSDSEQAVFVYAESQFFQTIVELGWPGFILLLATWALAWYASIFLLYRGSSTNSVGIGVAGVFATSAVAVASAFDFGLYYTANMLFMAVLCGFVAYHAQSLSGRLKKGNWLRFETPALLAKALLLLLFAGLSMFALDFYNKWRIENGVREYPIRTFAMDYPDLQQTDELIVELRPLVEQTQNAEGLAYMADLFIHRCRLQTKDELVKSSETGIVMLDEGARQRIWQRTGLDGLHEIVWSLREDGLLVSEMEFRGADFLRGNLKEAKKYLLANSRVSPMDARNHLLLAQVDSLVGTSVSAARASEKAVFLAPNNANVHLVAGLSLLQARQVKKAAPHLKKVIELHPGLFVRVMRIVFGQANRNLPSMGHEFIVNEIVPDNAQLLYDMVQRYRYIPADSPAARIALDRADELLVDLSASDGTSLLLKSRVKLAKDQKADAIDLLEQVLTSKPGEHGARYLLAKTLFETTDLEGAMREVEYLLQFDSDSNRIKRCEKLRKDIAKEMRQASR